MLSALFFVSTISINFHSNTNQKYIIPLCIELSSKGLGWIIFCELFLHTYLSERKENSSIHIRRKAAEGTAKNILRRENVHDNRHQERLNWDEEKGKNYVFVIKVDFYWFYIVIVIIFFLFFSLLLKNVLLLNKNSIEHKEILHAMKNIFILLLLKSFPRFSSVEWNSIIFLSDDNISFVSFHSMLQMRRRM